MTHETPPEAPSALPETGTIDINLVVVNRESRQRREIKTDGLKESIAARGLLHFPVVQRHTYELRAGERRLTACRELGWTRIPVRWFDSLDPIEAELVELEENVRRTDLPWQDLVRSTARISELLVARDPDATLESQATALGIGKAWLSVVLRVSRSMHEERVLKADGVREAYNLLLRRDQRNNADQLEHMLGLDEDSLQTEETLDHEQALNPDGTSASSGSDPDGAGGTEPSAGEPSAVAPLSVPASAGGNSAPAAARRNSARIPPPSIRCASFLDWLNSDEPDKLKRKFTLVHCDFPYGINLFDSKQGQGAEPTAGYTDTPETYFQLLEAFCQHLDRFMASSAHLVFWFSGKHREATLRMFRNFAPSIEFYPYDLIWHKSDNAGIAGDHRRHPRHTHETALFGYRNRRNILEVVADSYSGPTAKNLHPSAKPVPMLSHFFRMLVDENTRVFDPTAGSGLALQAAEALGAKEGLGLEIDQETAERAERALVSARGMRKLSKAVG